MKGEVSGILIMQWAHLQSLIIVFGTQPDSDEVNSGVETWRHSVTSQGANDTI